MSTTFHIGYRTVVIDSNPHLVDKHRFDISLLENCHLVTELETNKISHNSDRL